MVMGNRGDLRFRNQLGQGHAKGNVHGDGENIFSDQQVDMKVFNEIPQLNLQDRFQGLDGFGDRSLALLAAQHARVDPLILRVAEVGFGDEKTPGGFAVELAGEPEAPVTLGFKHPGPLAGLHGHPVRPGKARGHKSDIFGHCLTKLKESIVVEMKY
jgi:hypothetical protein